MLVTDAMVEAGAREYFRVLHHRDPNDGEVTSSGWREGITAALDVLRRDPEIRQQAVRAADAQLRRDAPNNPDVIIRAMAVRLADAVLSVLGDEGDRS